jgi:hypothetical protein
MVQIPDRFKVAFCRLAALCMTMTALPTFSEPTIDASHQMFFQLKEKVQIARDDDGHIQRPLLAP